MKNNMRILGIDYGDARTGLAITDALENVSDIELVFGTEANQENIVAKIPAVEGIEYTDILEEKAGANDANHLETRKSYSKIL